MRSAQRRNTWKDTTGHFFFFGAGDPIREFSRLHIGRKSSSAEQRRSAYPGRVPQTDIRQL